VNAEVFIDREAELAALKRLWCLPHPELSVLYGRRQVGKG